VNTLIGVLALGASLSSLGVALWLIRRRGLPPLQSGPKAATTALTTDVTARIPPPGPPATGPSSELSHDQIVAAARAPAPLNSHTVLLTRERMQGDARTEHLPRAAVLAAIRRHQPAEAHPPTAESGTVHLSRAAALDIAVRPPPAAGPSAASRSPAEPAPSPTPPEPNTVFMSRDAVLAAATRKQSPPEPNTVFMSRDAVLAAATRKQSPPEPNTAVLPREVLLAPGERPPTLSIPVTEELPREPAPKLADPGQLRTELSSASTSGPAPGLELDPEPNPGPDPDTELLPREVTERPEQPEPGAQSEASPSPRPPPSPAQPSSAARPSPSGHDIAIETLERHLDEGLEAMESLLIELEHPSATLRELVEGDERTWRGNLAVLSLTQRRVIDELLIPRLREQQESPRYRLAIALTLFELKEFDVPKRIFELLDELDPAGTGAVMKALAHWGDPHITGVAQKGLAQAAPLDRQAWLKLCVERNIPIPDPELEALLEHEQPDSLALGLNLVSLCDDPQRYGAKVDWLLLTGKRENRQAAIVAGLVLDRPTAALVSKQGARDPSMPEVCALHATLAQESDIQALIRWASKPSAPTHAGWALGLCGRKSALQGCIDRLTHVDREVAEAALAGFCIGSGFAGSAGDAPAWWSEHRDAFKPGIRYLGGTAISFEVVVDQLASGSEALRAALMTELLVRSKGRLRLPTRWLPSAYLEDLAGLDPDKLLVAY